MSETFLLNYEAAIRLGFFVGVFVLFAVLETLLPRKARAATRNKRWITNAALLIIDTLALRVLMPMLAVSAAIIAGREHWGLFHQVDAPATLEFLLAIVLLDLAIYGQHVAFHRVPLLWRVHKVHHADRDIDVTTGVRFHPIEILISMSYKIVCVTALGAPILAVIVFEILLNAVTLFNHANLRLPASLETLLRFFVVTPDMHRIHHSVYRREADSNFGSIASIWDRAFQTYIAAPADGHRAMTIGLPEHQNEKPTALVWSLALPFRALEKPQRTSNES